MELDPDLSLELINMDEEIKNEVEHETIETKDDNKVEQVLL